MTIYDDLRPIADELLGEFDQGGIVLIQRTPGTGPAYKPGDPTETSYTLEGVANGATFKYVQSGYALKTDLEVTVAALDDISVSENDFIQIDGINYTIVQDVSVPAAGKRVAWKFIVRKGG